MRTLVINALRGGSKGLPCKKLKSMFTKLLIVWPIDFAQTISWFGKIFMATDSQEIANLCQSNGNNLIRMRPKELGDDGVSSVEFISYERSLSKGYDHVVLLQPTTPVRFIQRHDHVNGLIQGACKRVAGLSLERAYRYKAFRSLADDFVEPWDPSRVNLYQEFPFAHEVNNSLSFAKVKSLEAHKTFFPKLIKSVLFAKDIENIDIHTQVFKEKDQYISGSMARSLREIKIK
jgi:CMP-N-acetylneuraminic acid synthetase